MFDTTFRSVGGSASVLQSGWAVAMTCLTCLSFGDRILSQTYISEPTITKQREAKMDKLTVIGKKEPATIPTERERQEHLADQWRRFAKSFLEGITRRSERSGQEYSRVLAKFFAHCDKADRPGDVVRADIEAWLSDMGDVAKATYNQRLAIVSSFFGKAAKTVYLDLDGKERLLREYNPAAGIERYKIDQYSRAKKVTVDQLTAILGQIDRVTEIGLRDYALMLTYVYTGRRRRELARMTWGDLEMVDGAPHYHYKGKGGKEKTRELPQPAYAAILAYLDASDRLEGMTRDTPLWTSTRRADWGKAMTTQAINNRLKYYAEIAVKKHPALGIDPANISLHSLRHAASALRRQAGADVRELQDFLDHEHISTTQIYLEALEPVKDERWRGVEAILDTNGTEAI